MAMVNEWYDGNNLKSAYEHSGNVGYSDVDQMTDFEKDYHSRFNSYNSNNESSDLRDTIIGAQNKIYESYVNQWLSTLDIKSPKKQVRYSNLKLYDLQKKLFIFIKILFVKN